MASSGVCFKCDRVGHTAKYCTGKDTRNPKGPPRGPGSGEHPMQTRAQPRAYAMTSKGVGTAGIVVTGTLSIILGHFALTLFDYGSTHSFVYLSFVSQVRFTVEPLLHVLSVGAPAG